jgi:hypothetical protein
MPSNIPRKNWIARRINLEDDDYWTVKRTALERGLGPRGFSAAARLIIRDWKAYRGTFGPLPARGTIVPTPSRFHRSSSNPLAPPTTTRRPKP